jgi:hypothetical protein
MSPVALRLSFFLAAAACLAADNAPRFKPDDPLQVWPRPVHVTDIKTRRISDVYDYFLNSFGRPGEQISKIGRPVPAQGVNTVGEVPDGAWYVNRHYHRSMAIEDLVRGPGDGQIPAGERWTVVDAKGEGVTPGFTIRDARGVRYLLKFDPLSNPEMATGAEMISTRLFYALGYHVPINELVFFHPSKLVLSDEAKIVDKTGRERKMRRDDIERLLTAVPRAADGMIRAVSSRYVNGRPIGQRRFHATRPDDPNDLVPHEHRRDLRGLRVFCAWLGHDDSRAINSFDALVEENGVRFVRHYLIDFGSTLGSASTKANSPRSGHEPQFSWSSAAREFFTLGLYIPRWARAKYPQFPSIGRFEYEYFDPEKWTPEFRNPAFENMLPDDAFWAARQVASFTGEELRAVVKTARYSDPKAEEWMVKCLIERRDRIARAFFNKVLPLDRFRIENGTLAFDDLGASLVRGAAKSGFEVAWFSFDNATGKAEPLPAAQGMTIPSSSSGYVKAIIRRPGGKQTVEVYVRLSASPAKIVGLQRTW